MHQSTSENASYAGGRPGPKSDQRGHHDGASVGVDGALSWTCAPHRGGLATRSNPVLVVIEGEGSEDDGATDVNANAAEILREIRQHGER